MPKNRAKNPETGQGISLFLHYNSIIILNQYLVREFSEILNPKEIRKKGLTNRNKSVSILRLPKKAVCTEPEIPKMLLKKVKKGG